MVCWASSATAGGNAPSGAVIGQGKAVFDKWCAMCHAVGEHMPGTASLQAKYGGSIPAVLEERKDMNPDFIRHFVRNGVLIMPAFRKTEITDADLDALSAYLSYKK
ncbi:cytochrome c [Cupriavidus lacunae]|uniref:Cytochrome c n=2 Tax=Cupriavidus lacunae TaxID=2666307 RepID=A0A370NL29_9BURK|nr:cytochrome c [Cupriavidus lacunae]